MSLEPLHERMEEALDEVIRACGGRKAFACGLWPAKTPVDALNLLNACLNPERHERFTPEQMMYILNQGRAVGCHAGMRFLAMECGYEVTPVEPEDERAQLQREYVAAAKAMAATAARIEALMAPKATLRSAG